LPSRLAKHSSMSEGCTRRLRAEADVDRERALQEQNGERSYYAHQCD
jgi:hypothetical protein